MVQKGMTLRDTKLAQEETSRHAMDAIIKVMTHPLWSMVLAYILIESLQKVKVEGQPLMGENVGTLLEGVFTFGTLESLAAAGTASGAKDDIKSLVLALAPLVTKI